MSNRGAKELPVDYQPVPSAAQRSEAEAEQEEVKTWDRRSSVCCRRTNCNESAAAPKSGLCSSHSYIIPVFILFVLVLIVLLLPWQSIRHQEDDDTPVQAPLPCQLQLVETLPIGMNFTPSSHSQKLMSTFEAWQLLLDIAKTDIDIATPYWALRGVDVNDSSTRPGDLLFQRLLSNADGGKPKLRIRIVINRTEDSVRHADATILANYNAAQVVAIKKLHTKLWIVDGQHFYLGSANMDWRSLSQVKELGVLAQNCPQLTADLAKIFKAYWFLGIDKSARSHNAWPPIYETNYNQGSPMLLHVNKNYTMQGFISSSPPSLSAHGRTHELDALLNTINSAVEFVHIAVMDYSPLIVVGPDVKYWPYIDDALRRAALDRGVAVKLLISWWPHSDPSTDSYLRSLEELSRVRLNVDIQVRRFVVPAAEQLNQFGFGRVNHNAYMVSDRIAYISGTSSWSGEFFRNSAGVGLVLADNAFSYRTLRSDLGDLFMRDWQSPYALPVKRYVEI